MPTRKHPKHGICLPEREQALIVLVTVCTKSRRPWLATNEVHQLLVRIWRSAAAWLVGRYVIMPDHIHLFTSPGRIDLPLENWVRYWKSQFSKAHRIAIHQWQIDFWDTRLRSWESYDHKWNYVCLNPIRHGLVLNASDWPFQGELNELRWD